MELLAGSMLCLQQTLKMTFKWIVWVGLSCSGVIVMLIVSGSVGGPFNLEIIFCSAYFLHGALRFIIPLQSGVRV